MEAKVRTTDGQVTAEVSLISSEVLSIWFAMNQLPKFHSEGTNYPAWQETERAFDRLLSQINSKEWELR